MTAHKAPRLATALLRILAHDDALEGDLAEQFATGKSRAWYWRQVVGVGAHDDRCTRVLILWSIVAAVLIAAGPTVGWLGTGRLSVPMVLGVTITSWGLWRFHRTSLALLYAGAVLLMFPHWMMSDAIVLSASDRVFWVIARALAGYGVVGVLLVPFLILRLGRSGALAEPPITLSLTE